MTKAAQFLKQHTDTIYGAAMETILKEQLAKGKKTDNSLSDFISPVPKGRIFLFSGASAVGKTAALRSVLPLLKAGGASPCVCKIDCLQTSDDVLYREIGIRCAVGLSSDLCPDHYLVSNLSELWDWMLREGCDTLLIETAGLCHRCSPATDRMTAGCVFDCTASCRAPAQMGPMLTKADFAVLTKIDMISQAELEIVSEGIRACNPDIELFPFDGLCGYGADLLSEWLLSRPFCCGIENDLLRHTMPGGVCSYCVGETRVGSAFQQGIVGKIPL